MTWLTIVGIGEDGVAGLGATVRQRIADAEIVFGGARHLQLAASLITGESRAWDSPFIRAVEAVLAERGRTVCVLASGDPFHYGVGATLSRHVAATEMAVFPYPSSFSLAAARMAWPLQEVISLSLHGRPLDLIRPYLHPGTRILALTSDETGPAQLAQLLDNAGFGGSPITVLEALGGPEERCRTAKAAQFSIGNISSLNVCAITVMAAPDARILPFASGLDDALFEHDGQITKRHIRALTLSALAPRRGELLWDIGAGSGSIGIEWMLADPSLRAIAIEADGERAARIARNAALFGVPDLRIVHDSAPGALADLPRPDAIFIGGGGSERGIIDAAIAALAPGRRLVVNAVTTQVEAMLLACHSDHGGELTRIAVDHAAPLGTMTGWRPARPITQWRWSKP